MPLLCAAFGCDNRAVRQEKGDTGLHRSFHKFPLKNKPLLKQWLHNLSRKNFKPADHHRLCSDHFTEDCFETGLEAQFGLKRKRALKPDAVPTVFTHKEPVATKRRVHTEERLQKKHKVSGSTAPAALSKPPDEPQPEEAAMDVPEAEEDLPWPLLPLPELPPIGKTNTGSQTDLEPAITKTTQTATSVKSVGLWCIPETKECGCQTSDDASTITGKVMTDVFTWTSPMKQAPVTSTFGDTATVQRDHGYSKSHSTGQDDKEQEPAMEFADESEGEQVPLDVAEITVTTAKEPSSSSSSSSSASSSPPASPQLAADPLYQPELESPESGSSDISEEEESETEDQRNCYIVFDDCLNHLLKHCPTCGAAILKKTKKRQASMLTVDLVCANMHCTKWNSQAKIGRYAKGNIVLAATVLFSGSTYTRFHQLCSFMGLAVPAPSTFFRYQKQFLFPVVERAWQKEKEQVKQEMLQQDGGVWLVGDGRCDSPGYSAKYGTYTLMDSSTKKIVDFEVVQVSEVTSSQAMELEGFKRVLDRVEESLDVEVVATDRHISINKEMDKNRKHITHQYDVWHFAKNVRKKLADKAKLKKHADLQPWVQSVSNHLWWCAATCNKDPKLLKEKWISILHHITNVHRWQGSDVFKKCEHPPYSRAEERKKKWLKAGGPTHELLQQVVMDQKLLGSMDKLTLFCHTGSLEVYHSLYNKYLPKRQHFAFSGMCARTMLAVLDNNNNVGRAQATVQAGPQKGTKRFDLVYPKGRKSWVVKPVFEKKSFDYVNQLVTDVLDQVTEGKTEMVVREQQQNIAAEAMPEKSEIIEKHRSRFAK